MRGAFVVALLCLGTASGVRAADFDAEVDPIAFLLDGYSLHLGVSDAAFGRFDVGAYGLEYPASFLASDKFTASFTGVGVKWDLVPTAKSGLFYGLQGSRNRVKAALIGTGSTVTAEQTTAGVRAGWRFGRAASTPRRGGAWTTWCAAGTS